MPHQWDTVSSNVTQSLQTLGPVGKSIGVSRTSEDVDNVNASGGVLDFMPEYILSDARGIVSLTHCSAGWAEWNTNGLISAIKYAIAVTNMTDGDIPCVVRGYLSTSNDLPVAWAEYHCEVAGNHLLEGELSFPGEAIYSKNVEDFRLGYIVIEAFGDTLPDLYDSCITNIGTGVIYAHSQYERKPGYIFYDKMVSRVEGGNVTISVPVEINAGGEFTLKGVLENSNGVFVASACTTGCTNGISEAMLEFKGEDIYRSGQNSPYVLAEIQLISPNNVVVDGKWDAIAIETLTYSQFRPAGSVVEIDTESFVHIGNSLDDQSQLKEKLSFSFECSNTASTDLGYELMATLTGTNGVAVTKCFNRLNLKPGKNNISLAFVGGAIRESAVDGPYHVSEVFLEPIGEVGIRERFVPVHAPINLKASDFGGVPFAVKGTPQYRETDGVSPAAVVVTVDVARPDTITASALLVDGEGRYVATAMTSETVSEVGEKTLTLSFDLDEVNASGRRGPYTISYLLLKSGIDGVEDIRIEDFEVKNVGDSSLTVFVDAANGDDENDGLTSTSAKRTISAAIEEAADGDKIVVADGVYAPFACANRQITIQSVNGPRYTIIDGVGTNRCATLGTSAGHTNTVLRGFTLRNGNANGSAVTLARNCGGGAYCGTLENCSIANNSAHFGGGVYGGVLFNCRLCGNEARYGGGAYCADAGAAGSFVISNSFIYGNVAIDGGGVYSSSPMAANSGNGIWNTVVANNTARNTYGGIYNTAEYASFVWNNRDGMGRADSVANPGFVDGEHCVFSMADAAAGGCVVGIETEGWGGIMEPGEVVPVGDSRTFTAVERERPFVCFMTNGVWATDAHTITIEDIRGDILVKAVFEQKTLYADASRPDDSGDGFSAATAKRTLQAAIDAAKDGETVIAAAGTYSPIYTVNRPLLIQSAAGCRDTRIDGGGNTCCALLGIEGWGNWYTNSVLCGFTLTNGWDSLGGGARSGWLKRCRIVGNKSIRGGGAAYSHLDNCLVANNQASVAGGVISSYCVNCTIVGNSTDNGDAVSSSMSCRNSIIWENYSHGEIANFSGIADNCITRPLPDGSGNRDIDPMIADAANGDGRLRIGSPCIDAGNNAYVSDGFDIDGKERISGTSVDIGAYEGGEVEGVLVGISADGTGVVSNSAQYVAVGGTATIAAMETVRPFLYWDVNGEQITNQVYTITNTTADVHAVAVFARFDWYVDGEYGDDANDGSDWEAAKRTLQAAIEAAVDGETIYVEAGTYGPIATDDKRIRIESINGAEVTFIDGGGTNRCATLGKAIEHGYDGEYVGYVSTELAGFTLLNGFASDFGGGSCGGSLECCIISNCVVQGPGYVYGGGAFYGTLQNCLVAFNRSVSTTNGYAYAYGYPCAFGGGTCYSKLRNCTVARNCAEAQAQAHGGGTYGCSSFNSIVWGNEAHAPKVHGINAWRDALYYCCTDATADCRYGGTITNDPQFVDADAGDFHLKVGSPCLDAGYDWYVQGDMDLDWDDRIQGPGVDMGCYEGAEYVAPPGQVTGLVAVRGVLAWDAMPDAEGFMVYRSTRRAASSAKYIGVSDTNAYTDETAIDGTTYYYWVQAFNTLGMGARSEGVENAWPVSLSITTSELPEAMEMAAYSARLEATGGVAPYSWSSPSAGYYVTTNTTSTFAETGTAQGWNADDDCWELELPFDFLFYGNRYRTAYVNSNGTIAFDGDFSDYSYSLEHFTNHVMIAALWNDLTTSDGDVYVSATAESVVIRWGGAYLNGGSAVAASATLYPNGDVKLSYGGGNSDGGFVGVSAGDGENFIFIDDTYCSRDHAGGIFLRAREMPNGLSLSEDGQLTGVPTETGTNTFVITVTDAAGTTAEREFSLVVAENPNHRPVIDGALPTTNVYVKVGGSATFAVTAHDPEGEPLWYDWYLDGTVADCEGAQFIFVATLEDAGAHTLECVVSDGLWTDKVRHQWSFRVVRDWFVDAAAEEGAGDGSSAVSALCSISEAMQQAEDGDTIYVAPGIYDEYIEFNSGRLLSVIATGGAQHTFLRGDIRGAGGEEWGHAQTVVQSSLTGFTMQGCYVSGVTLKDCILTGDETGVYPSETYGCRLFDCAVTGNTCDDSPIYMSELTRCTVAGNVVGDYGAVSYSDVFDSIVWGNVTSDGETANYDTETWWDCDEDGNAVEYDSVQFAHSCTWPMPVDGESAGVIDGDPRLVDAMNGDLRLRVGSSCIVEGVQTMGVNLGDPVAGHVISVRVEGHGSVSPMTAVLSEGETATFEVSDSTRPFLGFATNGVLATASDVLTWPNVTADGTVTATFSNFTFHVDAELGDDANDGLSWATAKVSIQSAIDEAVRGETIYVKAGTYEPIVVGDAMSLRIESVDGKEATVIDGGGTALCVSMSWMTSRSSTLVGFTLTNGYSTYGGGAYGGVLEDCLIVGNTAKYSGGGLYNSTARRCMISQNTVSPQGGSGSGGGASHCSLINCLVADNVVDADYGLGGGAIYSSLYNCTVVGNMVYGTDRAYGGGVYSTKLYNTIVFGNSLVAEDERADVSGEDADSVWGRYNSLVGDDPGFADAENGDYRLSAGSPCLDAGSNDYVMDDLDLDGNARVQHFTVDIGCYEYELTTPEHDADADFAAQMAGTCYGVFVGVNEYTYVSSLSGCNLDATNMQTRCVTKGYWHATNTVALLDASATKVAVRGRLAALAARAVAGDTVLYYQSSHGGNHVADGEYTRDAYLCLHDETYEDYEMAEDLLQFAAGVKVVVVLDTCHSAGMFKSVGAAACSGSSFATRVREIMAASKSAKGAKSGVTADDIGWIAAADYDEFSYDSALGGVFTVAMLDGWASGGADYDGDGRLNFYELWRYARTIATGYGETTAQCLNEDVLLSRFAGMPDSSDGGEATETTPVPVEYAWLDSYPEVLATFGNDYEAMASAQSPGANGVGKVWPDGSAYYMWQDFVAGTDPTNENSVFTAKIELVDGEPVVTWEPDTPELSATRVYRTFGRKTLLDGNWIEVGDGDRSEYRFFKVTVELP
ncbi:MAG: choice-of-anchor Q domain-containing protein [Kiritimatiellia bacterium]